MFDNTTPDDAIWNDETGETVGQARERFASFGPPLSAAEAINALLEAELRGERITLMSFGYGDDPEDFDSIELEELVEDYADDPVNCDRYWGPFAVWA